MKEELLKIVKEMDDFSKKYNCRLDVETYERKYIDSGEIYYKYILQAVIPEKIEQVMS